MFMKVEIDLYQIGIGRLQALWVNFKEAFCWMITVNEEFHRKKRVISILVNLRYLRFKPLKYKEKNKK